MKRRQGSIAVAMPAYNEADGIAEFVADLDVALQVWDRAWIVIVDDHSTDSTTTVLESARAVVHATVVLERNATNRQHGPTAVAALRRALELAPDIVLQCDGDGQIFVEDIADLADAVEEGADVAIGVRRSRLDPWFRRALSRGLRLYVRIMFGVAAPDANTPFRLYRPAALREMLDALPPEPMIPSVYMTVLTSRQGRSSRHVDVRHRVRRGARSQGSTWGRHPRQLLIPRRLMTFSARALVESVRLAQRMGKTDQGRRA